MDDKPVLHLVQRVDSPKFCASCPSCGHAFPLSHVSEIWIEDPIRPGWVAAYRLVIQEDEPVVAEVRLFPAETRREPGHWSEDPSAVPPNGVPGRAIKELKLASPHMLFPKITANMRRQLRKAHTAEVLDRFGLREDSRIRIRRPGRFGRDDLFYAIWAEAYVLLVDGGIRSPIKSLAADPPIPVEGYVSSGGKVSEETTRGFINEARERDLLTRSEPGRAGGRLTTRALRLLRSRET